MTSSSRKKKRKKSDFQKVKLKVGKKLPKGTNITNTAFKARKIQIKEQLHPQVKDPVLKKKKSLSDLLTGLNHSNVARQDALNGLKDLLLANPELIPTNLSLLLQRIGKYIEDKYSAVRKAALNVLKVLLSHVTVNQITPMFSLLSGHLCCAMTHLDPEIQTDSLVLMDIFLDVFPELLIGAQNQILTNFLEQISHQRYTKVSQVKNNNRTLSINPDNKLSRQTWRLHVLLRLQKFLNVLLLQNPRKDGSFPLLNNTLQQHVKWNPKERNYVVPKEERFSERSYLELVAKPVMNETNARTGGLLHNEAYLKDFITSLMPLLFETWIEACPLKVAVNNTANCLPSESIECLLCLLQILNLTQLLVDNRENDDGEASLVFWFRNTYEKDFLHYFMENFPYDILDKAQKKRKKGEKKEKPMEVLCCNLNLVLCKVFARMVPHVQPEVEASWSKVVEFLMTTFSDTSLTFDVNTAVDVLKVVLGIPSLYGVEEDLLNSVDTFYQTLYAGSKHHTLLTGLFCELIINPQPNPAFQSSETLSRWLMSLPKMLTTGDDVPLAVLVVMQKMAPRNNDAFLYSLNQRSTQIIERISEVSASGLEATAVQRIIVELLVWFRSLGAFDYKSLAKFVINESLPGSVRSYCIQVLSVRYQRNHTKLWQTEAANYISFLMTILTGFFQPELEKLQNIQEEEQVVLYSVVQTDVNEEAWDRHLGLMQEVHNSFIQFENVDQVKKLICSYLVQLLNTLTVFPLRLVWSLFWLLEKSAPIAPLLSEGLLTGLAELAFAAMRADYKTTKRFSENTLRFTQVDSMTVEVIGIIATLEKCLQNVDEVVRICAILSKLLQCCRLRPRDLSVAENIAKVMEERLQKHLETSAAWLSFQYELTSQVKAVRGDARRKVLRR